MTSMEPVRLAMVTEQLRAPVPGGTGRYTQELLSALETSADKGERVTRWQVAGLARAGRLRQPLLAELWRRGIGPAPKDANCVFAPTPLAPPARGRPLIVTIHDAVPWTHPETLTPRGARWHRDMGKRIAETAAVVVTPTAAVAAELAEHLQLRRVEVVGEGVSPGIGEIPDDAAERARRMGLPAEFVLAVGTLEPRKGLDVAAEALARESWPPGLPLLLAGPTGWGDVSLPPGARLLGRLSDQDLATVYSRASVLVMPSRAEGFGLPLLEAMTHGLPVVVSDAPTLVEVAGGAAIVVPRGNSQLLAEGVQQALTERLLWSAAGRARSRDFSWESAARRLWEIFNECLST